MENLVYATKINNSELTGLVNVKTQTVYCFCTKEVAEEILENRKKKFKIQVYKNDEIDGFAAYASPSIKKNEFGVVVFNLEASLGVCIEENISFKEMFVETIMHEVGHALEEFYDLEFSEERIEKITDSYRQKYFNQEENKTDNNVVGTYIGTQTPIERLRNKLSPFINLAEVLHRDKNFDVANLVENCILYKNDIHTHLADCEKFYSKTENNFNLKQVDLLYNLTGKERLDKVFEYFNKNNYISEKEISLETLVKNNQSVVRIFGGGKDKFSKRCFLQNLHPYFDANQDLDVIVDAQCDILFYNFLIRVCDSLLSKPFIPLKNEK